MSSSSIPESPFSLDFEGVHPDIRPDVLRLVEDIRRALPDVRSRLLSATSIAQDPVPPHLFSKEVGAALDDYPRAPGNYSCLLDAQPAICDEEIFRESLVRRWKELRSAVYRASLEMQAL